MGGATTQWLSYAHAVHSSPDRERFGKGAIEGVLGPGDSNNSTLGGSLITTISFGIPASVFMAILIGAFIMHGVVPGPDMLRPESQGGHLGLTYSFVWIVVLSNIITVGIIFLLLKQIVKVTTIRGAILIPFILMLIFLGAFAEKNAFPDLVLVLIFGALGWVLEKRKWPRPPLILGLVLGGLAESRLFLSVGNYGMGWLSRPMVLVLIAIILCGAVYPVIKARRERKRRLEALTATGVDLKSLPSVPVDRWSVAFTVCLVGVLGLALWQSRQFNVRAGLFPWAIGFPLLALALIQLLKEISGKTADPTLLKFADDDPPELSAQVVRGRTAAMFGWILTYFAAIWLLGFATGGTLCCFLQLKCSSKENWLLTVILTAGLWAFIYILFDRLLHVPFPSGYLFEALGWSA